MTSWKRLALASAIGAVASVPALATADALGSPDSEHRNETDADAAGAAAPVLDGMRDAKPYDGSTRMEPDANRHPDTAIDLAPPPSTTPDSTIGGALVMPPIAAPSAAAESDPEAMTATRRHRPRACPTWRPDARPTHASARRFKSNGVQRALRFL